MNANGQPRKFPANFLWGVSTAAYQVEGGNYNNQWCEWERAGGIRTGEQCGLACDWWRNAERDFDLAQQIGVNSLRLSVEWSRVEPARGAFDEQAIRRYREMLEALHQRGIMPIVCLHHFTHPLWVEAQGGFLSPETTDDFERFTRRVVNEFSDLCRYWVTCNEPNVYAALGYVLGEFPPGRRGDVRGATGVVKALARAHARAYAVIHELQSDAQVGWAHNYIVFTPADPRSTLDRWATKLVNILFNETFIALLERGTLPYPMDLVFGDLPEARGKFDFVGLNVYSRFHVAYDSRLMSQMFANVFVPPHVPQGDSGAEQPYGEAYPQAIRAAVKRVAKLGKPIYILENGVPDAADRIRPWLIVNVVDQLHALIQEGYQLRGYFHWSLTDNFEWSEGWGLRFGLYAMDRDTQARVIRNSGQIYSEIARTNELSHELLERYSVLPTQPQSR